jgi:hypothetical protein
MKANWVGIYERGNTQGERVHFRAVVNIDLNYFAVYDTTSAGPGRINLTQRPCYWFGPKTIKAGENVVLYTRAGKENTETRPDGSVYHFFFRGLSAPLYKDSNARAVLLELNDWTTLQ